MTVAKARDLARVVADLFTLDPADLDPLKPPGYYTLLEPLVFEIVELCPPAEAADILLAAAEKLDGCDLGPPGPLVSAVERQSGYEEHLMASVRRHPTEHTLWMVNRLLNSGDLADTARGPWLALLRDSATHPRATEGTRVEAERFLKHQLRQG